MFTVILVNLGNSNNNRFHVFIIFFICFPIVKQHVILPIKGDIDLLKDIRCITFCLSYMLLVQ